MKNAIIVHGKPSKEIYYSSDFPSSSNFAWIPWVQKQLIINDIKTDTPEMPYAFEPDYVIWKTEFERFDISPETILVGHSAGGGFLLRWLSEHVNVQTGKVILVAPGIDLDKKSVTGFCDFILDKELTNRVESLLVMVSDNDSEGILNSVEFIRETLPDVAVKLFPGYGHFIPKHMGKETFPELVAEILS